MELIINLGIPAFILLLAVVTNVCVEKNRLEYLKNEEKRLSGILAVNTKSFPSGTPPPAQCELVTGSVTLANNYFVAFCASWKNLFGGEMKGYTRLCSEARRTAIVRLLQDAESKHAYAVCNIRFESVMIQNGNKKAMAGVELIAYGTAAIAE